MGEKSILCVPHVGAEGVLCGRDAHRAADAGGVLVQSGNAVVVQPEAADQLLEHVRLAGQLLAGGGGLLGGGGVGLNLEIWSTAMEI